tara:strand:- start:313 stop:1317 length:1005 start_codon:yes stop_codon:yes gene_type:complete
LEEAPKDKNLEADSNIANLLQRTALNDGSLDNIIDKANCFTVKLPITVVANGEEIQIISVSDYDLIEGIFNASNSDQDVLNIEFPITIIEDNFIETVVNSQTELSTLANTCNGENIDDDDIECIDFVYPITVSIYNKTSELTDRITILSDKQLYSFLEDLNENLVVNVGFPINVVFSDGTFNEMSDLVELETTIDLVKDTCDEDDDYDFNDDNEEEEEESMSVSQEDFNDLLTACKWTIEEFELDGQNLSSDYNYYVFKFNLDGTISDENSGSNSIGTWTITSNNDNLILHIIMDSLTELNAEWVLHEINLEDDGTRLEIEKSEDKIKFKQDCS